MTVAQFVWFLHACTVFFAVTFHRQNRPQAAVMPGGACVLRLLPVSKGNSLLCRFYQDGVICHRN
jgi:hypothetical protein